MKRPIYLVLFLLSFACDDSSNAPEIIEEPETNPRTTELRTYIFGHSLINHEFNVNPVPSNETSVPHWMYHMAQAAGYSYGVSGQYGFLPQHDDLPPVPQWGFDRIPTIWSDETGDTFADVNFNSLLITVGNFIQYKSPEENYDGDASDTSPVLSTLAITDWTLGQQEGLDIYIYENWPDMAGFIESFPPTSNEFSNYHGYTTGDFHQWWLDYHDALIEARPNQSIHMIPVGPILSELLTTTDLNQVPVDILYEDDAPHGRPTIYFLAAMITYTAMYGEMPPAELQIPDIIDARVAENYSQIQEIIWNELEAFVDQDGNSRVW
jgi:hypothetical protein